VPLDCKLRLYSNLLICSGIFYNWMRVGNTVDEQPVVYTAVTVNGMDSDLYNDEVCKLKTTLYFNPTHRVFAIVSAAFENEGKERRQGQLDL